MLYFILRWLETVRLYSIASHTRRHNREVRLEGSGYSIEWFIDGNIDEQKLDEYLLSPTHQIGKHKLRLWQSTFGIGEGDGKLLERLIREQLVQATPIERSPKVVDNPRRILREWELLIPRFRGPNGNEAPAITGWTLDPLNERPHLSTAYPRPK